MKLRTKQDYKRAFRVIKRVIDKWDPYCLLESGAPSDEFEIEVGHLMRYVREIRTREDAIRAVSEVFSKYFEPEYFKPEDCKEAGTKLFNELRKESLI